MANLLLERDKAVVQESDLGHVQRHGAVNSYEAEIFRRVIKENWKSRVSDENSKQVVAMLEEHAAFMQKLFNSYEYEIVSLPNVIATCKRLSRAETRQYLKMIEALAVGYKRRYNEHMVSLLLAGLAIKAKDIDAAKRYFGLLTGELEGKVTYYSTAANAQNRRIDAMNFTLSCMEASLFARFFKKGELRQLKKKLDRGAKKKRKLEERRVKYYNMLSAIRSAAVQPPPKPDDGKPQQ